MLKKLFIVMLSVFAILPFAGQVSAATQEVKANDDVAFFFFGRGLGFGGYGGYYPYSGYGGYYGGYGGYGGYGYGGCCGGCGGYGGYGYGGYGGCCY